MGETNIMYRLRPGSGISTRPYSLIHMQTRLLRQFQFKKISNQFP